MSIEELKALIAEVVEEKLREVLEDPDCGLELRPEMEKRLRKSLASVERGEKGIPVKDAAKRLGIDI